MSKLFLVPTPIGNLEDITFRAVRILKEVDIILAEDTRQTGKLLKHYDIHTQMMSHHKFNEHKTIGKISNMIEEGSTIALVSDGGTPGISDPGFLLVRECLTKEIPVETLPGAVAFVPALVNSGLPCEKFLFTGFLPHKKGRLTKLNELSLSESTVVLYESPYRVVKTLTQIAEIFGEDRRVSVSRELTKMYEETLRGTAIELLQQFTEKEKIKGEFVIVIEGKN